MIKLYLDMDGVVANFDKCYRSLRTHAVDGKRFRAAVMEHKIFEDLEHMPNAMTLLRHVSMIRGVQIEMLTSLGTFDPTQGAEAKRQKMIWLNKHNIHYKANFVRSKEEKAKYADAKSILIDDSIGCITPFETAGGHGILHEDSSIRETLSTLDSLINSINGLHSLREIA
jgi:hypothetical protein